MMVNGWERNRAVLPQNSCCRHIQHPQTRNQTSNIVYASTALIIPAVAPHPALNTFGGHKTMNDRARGDGTERNEIIFGNTERRKKANGTSRGSTKCVGKPA